MSAYTAVQLGEVALFAGVLLYGVLTGHSSVGVLGGGLLIGKAVLNILAVEGGSLYRRSLLGYALGAIFTLIGVLLMRAVHP